jgi:drug/metabolite transporter (DMT)-like permease
MILLCCTGIAGHYLLIKAYDNLDAVAVQPITYLQLVLASGIAVMVFGEVLRVNMVIGAAIVVGAGLFTVWRENVLARRNSAAQPGR